MTIHDLGRPFNFGLLEKAVRLFNVSFCDVKSDATQGGRIGPDQPDRVAVENAIDDPGGLQARARHFSAWEIPKSGYDCHDRDPAAPNGWRIRGER